MNINETKEFSITVDGDSTGEQYRGNFDARLRLSHRLQIQKDRIYRELLGPNPESAAEGIKDRADFVSLLQVSITKAPSWFMESNWGLDLVDANVLATIWGEVVKIQVEAIKSIQKQGQEATQQIKAHSENQKSGA